MDYPLISAIMLIGKLGKKHVQQAIECFKQQSYPYKELIIVNNAPNQFEASNFELDAQRDIFLIDTPTYLPAGAAKNHGLSAANGQIIAQFDCDAWHHPKRLEAQAATLANNDLHAIVLAKAMQFSYYSKKASYLSNQQSLIPNTIMFIRPKGIDYPNDEKSEEIGLLNRLKKGGYKISGMNVPNLYCKFIYANEEVSELQNDGLTDEEFEGIKAIVTSDMI